VWIPSRRRRRRRGRRRRRRRKRKEEEEKKKQKDDRKYIKDKEEKKLKGPGRGNLHRSSATTSIYVHVSIGTYVYVGSLCNGKNT
jgi:hypothetical protein